MRIERFPDSWKDRRRVTLRQTRVGAANGKGAAASLVEPLQSNPVSGKNSPLMMTANSEASRGLFSRRSSRGGTA